MNSNTTSTATISKNVNSYLTTVMPKAIQKEVKQSNIVAAMLDDSYDLGYALTVAENLVEQDLYKIYGLKTVVQLISCGFTLVDTKILGKKPCYFLINPKIERKIGIRLICNLSRVN